MLAEPRRPEAEFTSRGFLPLGPDGRPARERAPMAPPAWQDRSVFVMPPPQPQGNGPFWGESDAATDERPRRFRTAVARFPIEHPLFCSVLVIATVLRIIAVLGYPAALWFPDSLPYLQGAMPLATYPIRPMGYSFLLLVLEPFHSVLLVVVLQHIMGLTIGVLVYVLLRHRYRLPSWGATLAAIPALLSAYTLQIEHYVLTDTFFALLITIALVLLLWNPVPKLWMCAVAGLLAGASAVVRSQGMLLAVPFVVYLATRVATSRRVIPGILLMCATLAAPIAAYAMWFEHTNGVFELTTSNGAFLYSRVADFADCAVIKPPADERWLCISTPAGKRPEANWYVWAPQSPISHGPGWEFSEKVNALATNFAIRAIKAQPADYLRVVWGATMQSFTLHTPTQYEYLFPAGTPESLQTLARANQEDPRYGYRYNGGADPSTRLAQPFAGWMVSYQRFYGLPGPLFGAIVLTGLAGVIVAWRRLGGWALLPWLTGVVLIVTPAATADFDERYLVASVPAFCIAAAIAAKDINIRRLARRQAPETHTGDSNAQVAGANAD